MGGSLYINAFSYLGDLEKATRDHRLYVKVLEILERFEPYLVKQRDDISSYKDVVDATMNTVLNTFNGNWESLESHVTNTAAKIPIHDKRVASLDKEMSKYDESEDGVTLFDVITSRHKVNSDSKLNEDRMLDELKSSQYLWSDWVDALKEVDLETLGITYEDITNVISAVVILELLDFYAKEEIALTALGKLDKNYYSKYFRAILNKLRDHFKMDREYVKEKLSVWGALYLQNRKLFKQQFHYLINSAVVIYNNSAKDKVSTQYMARDGMITRVEGASDYMQIYRFRYDEVLDVVFDEYFKDTGSKLMIKVGGREYFNVFGGMFTEERNLMGYLKENLKEYILNTVTSGYIYENEGYLYLSIRSKSPTIIMPMYYFGIMFTITLDAMGDLCSID